MFWMLDKYAAGCVVHNPRDLWKCQIGTLEFWLISFTIKFYQSYCSWLKETQVEVAVENTCELSHDCQFSALQIALLLSGPCIFPFEKEEELLLVSHDSL
eukprot:TRINITY_DN17297_c0_g2_i1.p1 TRINITY_DN17297_c0_g2~~TRINITY_DN17297_c0_g2_i1.p1  ORF type:complete len:100 (+),score=14.42 TRINITY_DN17297_c0_g2_i1:439-738(+)